MHFGAGRCEEALDGDAGDGCPDSARTIETDVNHSVL